ncbi:MAG: TolC family protein [Candidatus Eisenbacteria sp.]|nr:TolC family protein [Candidatus Eisenbacteria bacterium]
MHHALVITAAMVLLPVLASEPGGATPGDPLPEVRWEDIERTLESHPALRVAASEVAVAAAEVAASRQYPNPVLSAGLGRAEALEGEENGRTWALEVAIPILSPGVYRGEIAAAEAEHSAVVHDAESERLAVRGQLKGVFWRILHEQQRRAALRASRDHLARLLEVARLRVEMGEARPIEPNRFEIDLARLEVEIQEVIGRLESEKQILSRLMGGRIPEGFRVQGELSDLPALPPLGEVLECAGSRHPSLLASAARVTVAAARRRSAQAERFPEFEIAGFYEQELDARNYGGALQVSLPLWNWNSGVIERARMEQTLTRRRHEQAMIEREAAVRRAYAVAEAALERARQFRERVVPKAAETAAALERMYQVGEVDVLDVLDARRWVIETESELLAAYLNIQLGCLELTTLTGGYDDE